MTMYLTDNLSVPTKWRIPVHNTAATTIPAGGYLLIWADNDTTDSGLHANFKLSAGGEEVGLFDSDGETMIDSIIFADQTTDISFGRYPDASDNRSPIRNSATTAAFTKRLSPLQSPRKRKMQPFITRSTAPSRLTLTADF